MLNALLAFIISQHCGMGLQPIVRCDGYGVSSLPSFSLQPDSALVHYGASSLLSFSLQRDSTLVRVKHTILVAAVEFSRPASCLGLHADAGITIIINNSPRRQGVFRKVDSQGWA